MRPNPVATKSRGRDDRNGASCSSRWALVGKLPTGITLASGWEYRPARAPCSHSRVPFARLGPGEATQRARGCHDLLAPAMSPPARHGHPALPETLFLPTLYRRRAGRWKKVFGLHARSAVLHARCRLRRSQIFPIGISTMPPAKDRWNDGGSPSRAAHLFRLIPSFFFRARPPIGSFALHRGTVSTATRLHRSCRPAELLRARAALARRQHLGPKEATAAPWWVASTALCG
jgi:hypothetical protein